MADQTVATHLDATTLERLNNLAQTEDRSPSQSLGVSLRAFLSYSPNVQRALFAIDDIANQDERTYATRVVGRALLRAYDVLLEE